MAWIYLLIAGGLEIFWASGLKAWSSPTGLLGLSKVWMNALTVIAMVLSYIFLGLALRSLPLGVAYTIWTGIGAVGSVVIGILLFSEGASVTKIVFVTFIVVGIVGLKLTTAEQNLPKANGVQAASTGDHT